VDVGKNGSRNSILSIMAAWPWIWTKVISGDPFQAFWKLAVDMGKNDFKSFILNILGAQYPPHRIATLYWANGLSAKPLGKRL
jgi:hypothetical protein